MGRTDVIEPPAGERDAPAATPASGRSGGPSLPSSLVALVVALDIGLIVAAVLLFVDGLEPAETAALAALPVGAVAAVVGLFRFDWFIVAVLATRPMLDVFDGGAAATGLDPGTALGAMFVTTTLIWLAVQIRVGRWVRPSVGTFGLGLVAVAAVMAALTSVDRAAAVKGAVEVVAGLLMFVALEQLLAQRPSQLRLVWTAVAASAVVPSALAFSQMLGGGIAYSDTAVGRVTGTFVHPNPFATYLVMVLLLVVGVGLSSTGRRRSWCLAAAAVVGLMLGATYARFGWITALAGLAYLGLRRSRALLVTLVAIIAVTLVAVPSVATRLADLGSDEIEAEDVPENSLEWRMQYWEQLVPLADDSPATGLGLDTIPSLTPQELEAHNVFVQAYVEMGAFGLVATFVAVAAVAATLIRRRRRARTATEKAVAIVGCAVGVAVAPQLVSENLLTQTMAWWYFAAVAGWGHGMRGGLDPADEDGSDRELVHR